MLEASRGLHTTLFTEVAPAVQAVGGLGGSAYLIFNPSIKTAMIPLVAVIGPEIIKKMVEPAAAALLSFS